MDLSSASAASGDKTNILIPLILSMLGAGDMGKGLNFNLPNANGSGINNTLASITPPNALQSARLNTGTGQYGLANTTNLAGPVDDPNSNATRFGPLGGLMVGGQYLDKNGNPIVNFKQGGTLQEVVKNNDLMTPGDVENALKDAIQGWTKANAPSAPAISTTQVANHPAAAQPLPTYQPQTLPNPYQGMTPPNSSVPASPSAFNLGGFGGSGPNVGNTIPSAAYSGAAASNAGSPFAGGSFNGSPITESIGPTGAAQSGAGGLTNGSGMTTDQMGSILSAIQGLGQGIGKMFTPGILGGVQPVQMPQGITFGYTPVGRG